MTSKLTKGLLVGMAAALLVPAAASAQAYPYQGSGYGYSNGYYDPCARDTSSRSTIGGLTGAAIGAAVGSGMAAKGVRTEGSVLGGLVGAVIGAKVGNDSAACTSAPQPYQAAPPVAYEYHGPNYDYGYGTAPAERVEPGRDYDYGEQPYGHTVSSLPNDADGCQLAESPIYLPDGQVQKRFVRVCRDQSGRYQVVD
jgi:hypothetical protein